MANKVTDIILFWSKASNKSLSLISALSPEEKALIKFINIDESKVRTLVKKAKKFKSVPCYMEIIDGTNVMAYEGTKALEAIGELRRRINAHKIKISSETTPLQFTPANESVIEPFDAPIDQEEGDDLDGIVPPEYSRKGESKKNEAKYQYLSGMDASRVIPKIIPGEGHESIAKTVLRVPQQRERLTKNEPQMARPEDQMTEFDEDVPDFGQEDDGNDQGERTKVQDRAIKGDNSVKMSAQQMAAEREEMFQSTQHQQRGQ